MPAVTVRNLSDETHRALKAQAARQGRSTEAEIRDILEAAVRPADRVRLGSLLAEIGREAGGMTEADIAPIAGLRDGEPAEPTVFS